MRKALVVALLVGGCMDVGSVEFDEGPENPPPGETEDVGPVLQAAEVPLPEPGPPAPGCTSSVLFGVNGELRSASGRLQASRRGRGPAG